MAAKLSKAKRPKRRWIGFSFPSSIQSRNELEARFDGVFSEKPHFRLYDAHFFGSDVVTQSRKLQHITDEVGFGIVSVNLVDYEMFRVRFEEDQAEHNLTSLSSSGKIRLVRQRLGLPNQKKI